MSDTSKKEVANLFAALWGKDTQRWNHDQHMVAAGIDRLFLERTSVTESVLLEQISQLLINNPKACSADGSEDTSRNSRIKTKPSNRILGDGTAEPPIQSKEIGPSAMKTRVKRLRNRVTDNLRSLANGEAPSAYKVPPKNLNMEAPLGPVYDCLANIHNHQVQLYNKLVELNDESLSVRFRIEANRWNMEFSTGEVDMGQLLNKIQHVSASLDHKTAAWKQVTLNDTQTATAIRSLRQHLGKNNVRISRNTGPQKYDRALDLNSKRAEDFRRLLGCENRQFEVARMLAELDNQDVKNSYKMFVEKFANLWAQNNDTWPVGVCDRYEQNLIKQANILSEALQGEQRYRTTSQVASVPRKSQSVEKPLRTSLPSHRTKDHTLGQQAQEHRRRTDTASLFHTQRKNSESVRSRLQDSLEVGGSQHGGMNEAAHGNVRDPAEDAMLSLKGQRSSAKSAKLNVRLDLAGSSNNNTSRHLRWSPSDTRDTFFHKVAELFPGMMIRQVSVRPLHGANVNLQATGPQGEWEIVQEE